MPLISIIIPTCNRHVYLRSVLETLLNVTEDTEIVISDNSDTPRLREELSERLSSERIVYQHHTERLSVVENFERALHMSSGEYLIFIGDDDCVGPAIEDIARWAKSQDIDAVVSYRDRFLANYFWPGVKSKYFNNGYSAKLFVANFSGQASPLDTKRAIRSAARRPGSGLGNMARAYHGLLRRTLAMQIVEKYGSLFGGVSPDIYSAALISHEAKRAYVLDFPFVIPGGSPPSTAGQGAARTDKGGLFSVEHIQRFGTALQWNQDIPAFYSPVTVWSYSLQCALDRIASPSITLNYPRLYTRCFLQYREFNAHTLASVKHWKRGKGNIFQLVIGSVIGIAAEASGLVARVWNRAFRPHRQYAPLDTIGGAYAQLASAAVVPVLPEVHQG